ncbi:hypothetical protein WKT22_00202 [Candidatus Lokiarchaeum ossiferum]
MFYLLNMIRDTQYFQTWNSPNYGYAKRSFDLPILHVIGLVGSGKTFFIKKFFSNVPTFDIKKIYEDFGFSPEDLHNQPEKYSQFQSALQINFEKFLAFVKMEKFPIVLVESSGINQALNQILNQYNNYRIWIKADISRIISLNIYTSRPYAKKLNEHMLGLRKNRKIIFNNEFDLKSLEFSNSLPPILRADLNPFKTKRPNPERDNKMQDFRKNDRYHCPNCGANFGRSKLLELHFSRSKTCQKILG